MTARPPEHYVHGLEGPGAWVPGRVAEWLNKYGGLNELRMRIRGADAEVDSVLVGLVVAGHGWRASVYGTAPRNVPESAPSRSG
jgi:hypothetical protein